MHTHGLPIDQVFYHGKNLFQALGLALKHTQNFAINVHAMSVLWITLKDNPSA